MASVLVPCRGRALCEDPLLPAAAAVVLVEAEARAHTLQQQCCRSRTEDTGLMGRGRACRPLAAQGQRRQLLPVALLQLQARCGSRRLAQALQVAATAAAAATGYSTLTATLILLQLMRFRCQLAMAPLLPQAVEVQQQLRVA